VFRGRQTENTFLMHDFMILWYHDLVEERLSVLPFFFNVPAA
jgi:hypothetical protein